MFYRKFIPQSLTLVLTFAPYKKGSVKKSKIRDDNEMR